MFPRKTEEFWEGTGHLPLSWRSGRLPKEHFSALVKAPLTMAVDCLNESLEASEVNSSYASYFHLGLGIFQS